MRKTERNKLIRGLRDVGLEYSIIGDLFGITRQRAFQICADTNPESGFKRSWDDGMEGKIRKWHRKGKAMSEIVQGVAILLREKEDEAIKEEEKDNKGRKGWGLGIDN